MFVVLFPALRFVQRPFLIFHFLFSGRDHDYQTLNINFAANVVKFGMIISLFPKPLKPCVVTSTRAPLLLSAL